MRMRHFSRTFFVVFVCFFCFWTISAHAQDPSPHKNASVHVENDHLKFSNRHAQLMKNQPNEKQQKSDVIEVFPAQRRIKKKNDFGHIIRNRSIDVLESQLQQVTALEKKVELHIEVIKVEVESESVKSTSHFQKLANLTSELHLVKNNLHDLSIVLNATVLNLATVERDADMQAKKLKDMEREKKDEEEEDQVKKQGAKAVDYETGHLKNISGLSLEQLRKLETLEKESDPAVLHYNFEMLGEIALLFGASAVGGIMATSIFLPPTFGYLVGGAIIGPSGFDIIKHCTEVETFSLFGSIFLLFAHGAEYAIPGRDALFRTYLICGSFYFAFVMLFTSFGCIYLDWTSSMAQGIILGAAVCLSSASPIYSYIRVHKMIDSSFGRVIIALVVVQDVLMSFILATPELILAKSFNSFIFAFVKMFACYMTVVLLSLFLQLHVVSRLLVFLVKMEKVHHSPLVLLGVVSVCLLMALFTESLGLSLESGAFFAGLSFMGVKKLHVALNSIHALDNLFGSIFFACIGMIINPVFLFRNLGQIISMVILVFFVKTILAATLISFFGSNIQKSIKAAISLSQIGEFSLIFMIKSHAMGLVSRRVYLLFVAMSAIFLGCSPFLHKSVQISVTREAEHLDEISDYEVPKSHEDEIEFTHKTNKRYRKMSSCRFV